MYNEKAKAWECGQYPEGILDWCTDVVNKDNPQALFVQADILLSQASRGKRTADAVYLMERAAKLGYPPAALAMGQLFQYGWAVSRSEKQALVWYAKAAELGNTEAQAILNQRRRRKRQRIIAACVMAAIAVCLAFAAAFLLPKLLPTHGVLVGKDTVLLQPATQEEFTLALNDLLAQYDTELVIAGQQSTNRLLLKFEGSGLDLSRFPAATVIADSDNYVVIQFRSQEEAESCLAALREKSGVLFVDMDEYAISIDASPSSADPNVMGLPYFSSYSGALYYSWGAQFMGLDQLAAWLTTQQTEPVIVAVLDTGTEPCPEILDRILKGTSIVYPGLGNGWRDQDGHGTHVAGTIIDCTQGLDISILPVQVFSDHGQTSDAIIIQGLRYSIYNGANVINMSLSGPCSVTDAQGTCDGAMDYYIREAISKGIVVVVSAGNGDENENPVNTNAVCPAHIDDCIVVGACDSDGIIGSFSNYGASVDVCAPGIDILSYAPEDMLAYKSGTSMAAPHICALAAMLKLYLPNKTPAQIEKYIKDYCIQLGDSAYYGEGIPWAGFFAGD